jgi:hypothetical protein
MSTKAEILGCEYETGMCEHYIPGDGKVINGVVRYPGIGNVPMGHGRCLQADKMISRIVACPVTGKSAKKQTKVERFGCIKSICKHYATLDRNVPCCLLVGEYSAINALHECPKTKQQSLIKRRIEEWGQEEPPNWEITPKQREEFSEQASQPELTQEELAQKRMAEYGCKDCVNYNDSQNGHICKGQDPKSQNRLFKPISMVEACPDRRTHDNPWSQTFCGGHSIVPAGKERWDYRTLPGDIRAVDYWYDVDGKDVFETTCVNLEDCRKARDRYFEDEARRAREIPQEKAPPPVQALPMRILALDVSTKCTGWALREGDKIIEHGSIKATGDDTEKRKEIMRQGVINYCLGEPLNCVLMERSFIQHNDPSRIVCEMQGILKNLIHRVGFKLLEPSPTTWRAVCPGSGKCDKVASVEFARLKGYVFESEDEAEAICMAFSFGPQLMASLEESKKAKEKKKNGKSKGKEGNGNNNHGSNGGNRGRAAARIAVPSGAAPAAQ